MAFATFFTPKFKPVSRSKGESCVYKGAYNAGASYVDDRTGEVFDHTKKDDVFLTWCENWDGTPEQLWNAAEKAEKTNPRARTAYDYMVPLPNEWTDRQRVAYSKALSHMMHEEYGVAMQFSLHKGEKSKLGEPQHHLHILMTTRTVENNIFNKKKLTTFTIRYPTEYERKRHETADNNKDFKLGDDAVKELREKTANLMNEHYKLNGFDTFVTGGKFEQFMDEDYTPMKPLGKKFNYKGGVDKTYLYKLNFNKSIKTMRDTKNEINKLQDQLKEIEAKMQIDKQAQITKTQLEARQQMAKAQIIEKQEAAAELVGKDIKFKEELKTQLQQDYAKYEVLGERVIELYEQIQECKNLQERGIEPLGMLELVCEHSEKVAIIDKLEARFKDPQFKELLLELNIALIFYNEEELQSVDYTQTLSSNTNKQCNKIENALILK